MRAPAHEDDQMGPRPADEVGREVRAIAVFTECDLDGPDRAPVAVHEHGHLFPVGLVPLVDHPCVQRVVVVEDPVSDQGRCASVSRVRQTVRDIR